MVFCYVLFVKVGVVVWFSKVEVCSGMIVMIVWVLCICVNVSMWCVLLLVMVSGW